MKTLLKIFFRYIKVQKIFFEYSKNKLINNSINDIIYESNCFENGDENCIKLEEINNSINNIYNHPIKYSMKIFQVFII